MGPFVPTHIVDGFTQEKPKNQWTDDDKRKVRRDTRSKHFLLGVLSDEQLCKVSNCASAQEVWNSLRDIHEGTGDAKIARIDLLTCQYEAFSMKPGENIQDMEMRFYDLVNHLASLGKKISNVELVYKVLRSLSRNWQHKVRTIKKSKDLSTVLLNILFRELEEHEQVELNRLDENEQTRKKKKDSGRVAASRNNDEEDDSDDSKEIEWHFKRIVKLLKKKNFKKEKKEHKKRGSASTRTML